MADDVREIWSDQQLDIALATLRSEVDTDRTRIASTRTALLAAAGAAEPTVEVPVVDPVVEPAVRRRSWWAASAAAAVLIVAVVLVAQFVPGEANPPATRSVELLEQAAANTADEPVGPGQYRMIYRHAGTLTPSGDGKLIAAHGASWDHIWIPQNWREDWKSSGGCARPLRSLDNGADYSKCEVKPREVVLPCGALDEAEISARCDEPGSWGRPNPLFLDSVPRDPDAMRDRMIADYDPADFLGGGPDAADIGPEEKVMRTVRALLGSGETPADVRAVVYRMLARLPGLTVTDPDANLDGRRGVAFGIEVDRVRLEVIVEPATGELVGLREVQLYAEQEFPVDTARFLAVSTAVVDEMGEQPQ